MAQSTDDDVATSIIVVAELRYGVTRRKSPRLQTRLDAILNTLPVLEFAAPADRIYGELRAKLESHGRPISGNDLLIAAHALALGRILVTANEREFARIPNLKIENWLR
jgi:tRNA(fMet)-specific endonuclease VapC